MTAPDCQGTRVVTRARRVEPGATGIAGAGTAPRVAWRPPGAPQILAGGVAARLRAEGSGRFEEIRGQATRLFDYVEADAVPAVARPRLFGGGAFHAGHEATGPWVAFPGAEFVLPNWQLVSTPAATWLTVTEAGADATPDRVRQKLEDLTVTTDERSVAAGPGIDDRTYASDPASWRRAVRSALDRIGSGDLQKVVLAQALAVQLGATPDPWSLLRRLEDTHPDSHCFCFQPADGTAFLGATPERLVSLDGETAETAVLAGSIERGDSDAADERLESRLQDSPKDDREHRIAVETIRDRLSEWSASVTTGERTVRKLPTVQHLETPITATLSPPRHVLSLVDRLHPTPTVGGRPAAAALRTIRSLEPFERGWYAAPVGWVDADGNGSFVVAIRSAVLRDRLATLFAGAGIVADSNPEDEWEEVRLKYRPVLDALE